MAELATTQFFPSYDASLLIRHTDPLQMLFSNGDESSKGAWPADGSQGTEYFRPPEEEIYGRSLSTIHKLGAFMIGKAMNEIVDSPEADQARVEFYTSVEEGFGTDMELGGGLEVRDFDMRPVIAGKVVAKDYKTAISDMTEAGLTCAEEKVKTEIAQDDYRFVPQFIRSQRDHENALLVDAMARGETDYNTRIVISPFPEEAAARSGDEYWRNIGYVPHLKRGFVQLYHATESGLAAGSLSFDGSDKEKLRELFGRYNVAIPESEITDNWLQYAITDTLSESEAKSLALEIADLAGDPKYKKTTNTVDITSEYRAIMDMVFNESYIHACESLARGHQTSGVHELILHLTDKAGSFNNRYAAALYEMRANDHKFTDDDMVVLHELLVYSTIEMLRALHTGTFEHVDKEEPGNFKNGRSNTTDLQAFNRASFQSILSNFGAEGARNNRTYSACGLSISPGDEKNPTQNPQLAFGGTDNEFDLNERKNWKTKIDTCVVPGCPTRPGRVVVGPCGVCMGRCQKLYDAGKDPAKGLEARKIIGESLIDKIVDRMKQSKQNEFVLTA